MKKLPNILLALSYAGLIAACETRPADPAPITPPGSSHHKLSGTSWVWEAGLAKNPVIEFKANGHLGGYSGCNQIGGVFEESAEIKDGRHRLGISEVISTQMACSSGMKIEQDFIQAINASESFNKLSADDLILYDKGGNEILRLKRQTN